MNFSGISTRGGSPSERGSVIVPVTAAAAAVCGLTRYAFADFVPLLPRKLRLLVRRLVAFVRGA
jgi:hypothetical protein